MQIIFTKLESLAAMQYAQADLTQKARILVFLQQAGPCIRDVIAEDLDIRPSSVCARLNELVSDGKVFEQGVVENPLTKRRVVVYAVVKPAVLAT